MYIFLYLINYFNEYYFINMIETSSLHVEVPSPNVIAIQPKSNVLVYEVEHNPNMECYSHHTFQHHVIWYPVISGVPDETQLQNGFSSNDTVMIDGLMSDMSYIVNITAECVGNEDVVSDPLSMNSMTVGKGLCIVIKCLRTVCYYEKC